jgi:tRNA-modifying protein YgfZ
MPDNPQDSSKRRNGDFFALSDHRVLELAGPDAVAFAQAQLMNEVAALPVGHWQWNGWLTPKGRVIALCALLKRDAETLWLVLPDADPVELAAKLQRYVFRSKVKLTPRDDLFATGAFRAPDVAAGNAIAVGADIELDFGGEGGARTLRIGTAPVVDDADVLARWKAFDLAHGLPRLPAAQAEQWTPQMLSLDRLKAFSVKKGCYPGQEIVARTHFLGQVKRGLARFDADGEVSAGAEVQGGEHVLGTVISVARSAPETADVATSPHLVLAVLPLEFEASGLRADGIALGQRPLLDGLQR